jgi:predicted MFS family arabinose efflux permease
VLLFSLFAGVIIDKLPKKRILYVTQAASLTISLILALLTWSGSIKYWQILVLSFLLGVTNTFDAPSRQSFIIEIAGREDLMNAIALNSSVFNLARIIGPALAGLLMGFAGVASCFMVNSISFAVVIITLIFIKPAVPPKIERVKSRMMDEIKDGLRHIYNNKLIFRVMMVSLITATFAMNFSVLVPVFAKEVLGQQEAGFGFLMSFMGIGSFVGAMLIAANSRSGPNKYIITAFPFVIAAALTLTAFTGSFIITGLCLAACGFFFISFNSTANSTIQLNTGDEYRGRVMSVYSLVFSGSTPIGNLYAGIITEKLGPQAGFAACGLIIVLLMALMLFAGRRKKNDSGSYDKGTGVLS